MSQTFRLAKFTTHDGLPIDNVYAAAQDDNGFIWFGTDFGIARFDGSRFVVYDKKNGMANKAVTDIVYAGGDSLIFCSYPSTLQSIHKDGHINTLVENTLFGLQQLIRHKNQFYFYNRGYPNFGIWQKGKFLQCKPDSVFDGEDIKINNITSLNENGLAFCTSKGLFIKKENQWEQLLQNQNVQFAVYSSKKNILAITDDKLLLSYQNFQFKELPVHLPPKFIVYHAIEDKAGNFWLRGLDKGIYRLDEKEIVEVSDRLEMTNKALNEFFTDADGNLWFCTDGAGILLKRNSAFYNYETKDGLANNKVIRLLKQDNGLLIGTSNGLSVMRNKVITKIDLPKIESGLQYITQLFSVSGKIAGICVEKTVAFSKDPNDEESLIKNFKIGEWDFKAFKSPFAWTENENNYWLLNKGKLFHLQNDIKKTTTYDLASYKVRKGYCMTAFENKLWLGTDAGLLWIDNDSINLLDTIVGKKIRQAQVFKFLVDKKNRLWIATDVGLILYENKKFVFKETGQTAASNYCTGLTEDDKGRIWVSTWDGIFVIGDNTKKTYNTNDGLPSKTTNCVLFDTTDHQVYVGTDNGLAVLEEKSFLSNNSYRKIFISCNLTGNEDRLVQDSSSLQPNENNLNFYLSFPYYQEMNKVIYEYKLDDGPWVSTTNPAVNISDISSGQHRFYARAKINDAVISKAETVFFFTIKKTFYQKWWFWLLAALLLQVIIFRIVNRINKNVREKKIAAQLQQAEYASLKQQAFTSLMNPHFIFNALNSVQHYINKQDRQLANKYLSNFATLIRRSFEASQKSFVTLEEELETMRLYLDLEKMRFADKFDYTINVSPAAEDDNWMLPSMMLQPFLENAVLHGLMPLEEKGLLTIDVNAEHNALQIVIADNGIGIKKSKALRSGTKHNSKGMQLIKERLEILSKLGKEPITLIIAAQNMYAHNPGTKIILTIPQEVYELFQQQRNPS